MYFLLTWYDVLYLGSVLTDVLCGISINMQVGHERASAIVPLSLIQSITASTVRSWRVFLSSPLACLLVCLLEFPRTKPASTSDCRKRLRSMTTRRRRRRGYEQRSGVHASSVSWIQNSTAVTKVGRTHNKKYFETLQSSTR